MRHAFLIIAHTGWEQLSLLVSQLDHENNDIYIHIDKKAINAPINRLNMIARKSNIYIFQEYKVYWGSFEMVQVELFLFRKAHEKGYDYYHLISGADMLIKPLEKVHSFFKENEGKEFVHFDTDNRLLTDKEISRRTRLFHFLQNYRRRYRFKVINEFFTLCERILLFGQLAVGIDRMKKHPELEIRYGSQWVSITHNLVVFILDKETLIYEMFSYTNCADELFIQTLVYNSEFKKQLYHQKYDNSIIGNIRLIDWSRGKNGNPYTWRLDDIEEIEKSPCFFARKFNIDTDRKLIETLIKR